MADVTREGARLTSNTGLTNGALYPGADLGMPGAAPYDPTQIDLSVLGRTGLKRAGGYVFEEFLTELTGDRGRRIFREMMDNDPVIGAILFAIEMHIRRTTWTVAPFDDTPEAKADAEFFESCLHDMDNTWEDTVAEVLSMLGFGWSFFETNFKLRHGPNLPPVTDPETEQETEEPVSQYDDGKIGWRGWSIRSQESLLRWEFDELGYVVGMWQIPPPDYKLRFIPMAKALLFRTTAKKDNPEGRSVIRNAYTPWYAKTNIERLEAIGIERDLAGLPVAYGPARIMGQYATEAEKATFAILQQIVTNIRNDEQAGLVFPMDFDENHNPIYKLELMHTAGQKQFDTNTIIQRKNLMIAIVVLADWILVGHERGGSYAMLESKGSLFAMALVAWLDAIVEQINRFAFPRLARLNGMALDRLPKLQHGDVQSVNLEELGAYLQAIATAGAPLFPNNELLRFLLQQASLPAPLEEPDTLNDADADAEGESDSGVVDTGSATVQQAQQRAQQTQGRQDAETPEDAQQREQMMPGAA